MSAQDAPRDPAGSRHGGLRLHGRRPLAGLAHRRPGLRPAAGRPHVASCVDATRAAAAAAAAKLGWDSVETDWEEVIERDDVQLVDICTPGSSHAEIAIAALAAGKHVLCEKPLANTVPEARAMVEAARGGPGRAASARWSGFNYRRVPAVTLARQLVAAGRLGTIRHVRAQYLQDWIVDPEFPLVWRLRARGGRQRRARRHRRAHRRPDPVRHRPAAHRRQRADGDLRQAAAAAVGQLAGCPRPAAASSATSPSTTRRCSSAGSTAGRSPRTRRPGSPPAARTRIRVEVNGSAGSLAFDLERLNELEFYDGTEDPADEGFRRILVTEPTHPYLAAWWPPGHILGWARAPFTHEVQRPRRGGRRRGPTRYRRSRTGCRCSSCSTRCSARPPTAAAGPTWRPCERGSALTLTPVAARTTGSPSGCGRSAGRAATRSARPPGRRWTRSSPCTGWPSWARTASPSTTTT